jgi:hypothetical protein
MRGRKRCPFCNELFWPDCRTAKRQWSCRKTTCQTSRRKETQRRYRAKDPTDRVARRLRAELAASRAPPAALGSAARGIWSRVPWDELRDEIPAHTRVLIEFFVQLVVEHQRDEMRAEVARITSQLGDLGRRQTKDETACDGPPG